MNKDYTLMTLSGKPVRLERPLFIISKHWLDIREAMVTFFGQQPPFFRALLWIAERLVSFVMMRGYRRNLKKAQKEE